jgi:membrane-associated PAP2 superfamily phosphatase
VLILALLVTAVFWVTDLDLTAAAWFAEPSADGTGLTEWPHEHGPLFKLLYLAAPAMTGLLGFSALAMMVAGTLRPQWRKWRLRGLFVLLVLVFGPGLVVNAIFKDHWGRPRPREVVQFNGDREYLPPFRFGIHGVGKSFPCGHCSVAFAFLAFWLLCRGERSARIRKLGRWILLSALLLGGLVGAARMAAGAHFLSDVLWAGVFTYFTAWILYYPVLKLPQALRATETQPLTRRRPKWVLALYAAAGAALLAGLLLATPLSRDLEYERVKAGSDPTVIYVTVDEADVILRFTEDPAPALDLRGSVRAFGFPTNTITETAGYEKEAGVPVIRYSLERRGVFTEYRARVHLLVSAPNLAALHLDLGEGNLRLENVPPDLAPEKLRITAPPGTELP